MADVMSSGLNEHLPTPAQAMVDPIAQPMVESEENQPPAAESCIRKPGQGLPKVVAIGFNKCATRSLALLFARSGHRAVHQKLPQRWRRRRKLGGIMRANHQAGRPVFSGIEDYIFYGDLIDSSKSSTFDGNCLFREILADYPDTILLLNWRDQGAWIRSRLSHGHGEFAAREQWLRGLNSQEALVAQWRQDWDGHLVAVRSFMADRPLQLLDFNIDHDRIESLIARLPAYGLRAEHFIDIGRSRGRQLAPWLACSKAWLSRHRPRAQR
jgi:hypothetical protein